LLCSACSQTLPRLLPPLCPRCGLPQPNGLLCADCRQTKTALDGIRAPFRYEGLVRQAVLHLKYHNLSAAARPLAGLMADYLSANPLPGDVLVPVPLHPKRLRERGYNQAELLAKELGRRTGLPVAAGCLVRTRYVSAQVRTSTVEERRRNVAGAFACRDGKLAGKAVILVDDVSTSGATFGAGARALKEAGAAAVWGLSLAREV